MIQLRDLVLDLGGRRRGPLDWTIPRGRHAIVRGLTGVGKTTLLETVAGLRSPASGTIWIHGINVTGHRPADRCLGYVPQDARLLATRSVGANLALGLQIHRVAAAEASRRVQQVAESLGLADRLGQMPAFLSGGERQRVSLGRALVMRPDVLLLDEPFASLDARTSAQMNAVVREVQATTNCTIVHVSHADAASHCSDDLFFEMGGETA